MPDEMPVSFAEHGHAAARADMEFGTSLTAARHHIEYLLSAFSHAVCNHDADALGELTRHVRVSLHGHIPSGESKAAKIIDWFAHADRAMTQIVTNISLRFSESNVLYSATYPDWETGPAPLCTAIGKFHGRLKAGPQVWRWAEHKVTPFDALAGPLAVAHQLTSQPTRRPKTLQSTR